MQKLFSGFLLLALSLTVQAQNNLLQRIEPANWWVGMHNPELQILLHGDKLAGLTVKVDYPGVQLEQVVNVTNPNYLFIYLKLTEQVEAGDVPILLYKNGQLVEKISYPLLARSADSKHRQGFDSSDVMYLITPDRFANGNLNNDNIAGMADKLDRAHPGGRHGGDIEGIRKNLDYIQQMGFTAIWLNPVLENDMPEYSYHGYAATDMYKVDARFGSNEEYKAFIAEAKQKGIKVIMDMIVNHVGSEHWFVKDQPTADWINFADEFVGTSHRRNTVQDLYASEYDKKRFSDGWFVETMPDLNQKNPLLADYLIQNTLWWIEYSGITGIRMDTYPYPDKNFMARWTCEVMTEYPNFNIVGEEWVTDPAIVSYWQGGKQNHDGYTSCLPSLMDFPLQAAIVEGLTTEEKTYGSGLIQSYKMLAKDFLYAAPEALVIFPDNHDMNRFFSQVNEDIDLFKMGMVYFATMRGVPQIFYGTEVLMKNDPKRADHGEIRSDFPGGWPGDKSNAMTGKNLTAEQQDAQNYLKKLLNWRKSSPVIHRGKLMQYVPDDGVYVYFRYDDKQTLMIVMNKNDSTRRLNTERFSERVGSYQIATEVLSKQSYKLANGLPLAAKTAYIFNLER
ncbi:glycoside hydrolase family 13 protein [Gayadomonas joobiniege]|uniref:glycoside hydrolase family 13 protein n=1 Tax=Gayadomonas joobiniege TaxID=1234606 RepID=UPI000378E807|nr:glycoside hydrolase family 13 protein [Gayadomonas joobiniege]